MLYDQQPSFTEEDARGLCQVLLEIVKYCHDRGFVHRDLRPESLLLHSPGDGARMKLANFGLACNVLGGDLTTFCGTPEYMAPEILKGIPYGAVREVSIQVWLFNEKK